jgi:hypothetical protein
MTPWSAPGSTISYYQCPFCARTHSSLYGEVFRRRAGARLLDTPPPAPAPGTASSAAPMASQEDVRWARVKASAARWFARLEEDERRLGFEAVARPLRPAPRAVVQPAPRAVVQPAPRAVAKASPRAVARPVRAAEARPRAVARPPRPAEPADGVPEVDPDDVIEVAPAAGALRR